MTRKRSKYRPTHVATPSAYMIAIQGAHKLCASDQLTRAAKVRCSVEELAKDASNFSAWRDVFDAVNFVEAFWHIGVVRFAREWVEEKQQCVVVAMDRLKETGSNVIRPCELDELRDLASTYAQVLAEVTCREYFEAETRVIRRVQQAMRNSKQSGVRVVEFA